MTDEIANQDDSEFDSYFDEFADGKSADNDIDETTDDEQLEPEGEPAEEASEEEGKEGGEAETEKPEEPDELTKLQEENKQLKHQFNSTNGRVSAFQRQNEQLKQQLAQASQRTAQQPAGDNPENSGMSDEKWESLKKDYPDIAEAMELQLNGMRTKYESQINEIKQKVQPLEQYQQKTQHDNHINSQMQSLNSAHPDWQDVVKTPDYSQWLRTQPASVQELMNSTDAQDNIFLLNTFKATRAPQAPAVNPVTQKREKALQQARTIPNRSRNGAQSVIAEDDFEAAFDYYAEKANSRTRR